MGTVSGFAELTDRGLHEGEKPTWAQRRKRQIPGHGQLLKAGGQRASSQASTSEQAAVARGGHKQDPCKLSPLLVLLPKHSGLCYTICWSETATVTLLLEGRPLKKRFKQCIESAISQKVFSTLNLRAEIKGISAVNMQGS